MCGEDLRSEELNKKETEYLISERLSFRLQRTVARRIKVAVSLGTGSVLLVGGSGPWGNSSESKNHEPVDSRTASWRENHPAASSNVKGNNVQEERTRGLVQQLRVLGRHDDDALDTQETSCYVLEGSHTA
ncbi:uncharacterized protein [Venturia canescens]|uniref:uncharacterized protein n=1 Tax=Venturia canescens TaxID=32260 RepID=UPI001C9C3F7C|nr:uncharacterized protein LOC122408160 [Venturia canescens]